jgi:glycosyltransferase involved in cell wall biosynthesis
MRIAIVNNAVPFVRGGAEFFADSLVERLTQAGHDVELVRIPFQWEPPESILDQILAVRLMRLEHADCVVAMKFPAYYIQHPNKVIWLVHQFRQAYDLWGTGYQCIPDTPAGATLRRAIIQADNAYLPEARKLFAINPVVAERLRAFNQLSAEVVYTPPPLDIDKFHEGRQGDYFFCPSRISRSKRQCLLIEAMRFCKTDVRLVLAGAPDHPSELDECHSLLSRYRLNDRVELHGRFISQEEKIALFADSFGCAYVPYDEDSYGFVTLEAFSSHKPVVTTSDAGGVLEAVKDGQTGLVVPPTAEGLAEAMDGLYLQRDRARRMGIAGLDHMRALGISWDNVVTKLTT